MAEWLILLLLFPAVVVPVVLLVGFAGCDVVFGLEEPPAIVSAKGKSVRVITLTWTYESSAKQFQFERMKLQEQTTQQFNVPGSPYKHDDDNQGQGLEPNTVYQYRVRAILGDGEEGHWSHPVISGSTLPFVETFAWTAKEQADAIPNPLQRTCIIQRIDKARLSTDGGWVRLTLSALPPGGATINAISISRPDPAPGKHPYDSDTDLTLVASAVVVPAYNSRPLPAIEYDLDPEQDLLIAIEFSGFVPSTIKKVDGALGASAFYKVAAGSGPTGEAANPDRTGFLPAGDVMYLIEKIEVG
jgi:hypothetical protein